MKIIWYYISILWVLGQFVMNFIYKIIGIYDFGIWNLDIISITIGILECISYIFNVYEFL